MRTVRRLPNAITSKPRHPRQRTRKQTHCGHTAHKKYTTKSATRQSQTSICRLSSSQHPFPSLPGLPGHSTPTPVKNNREGRNPPPGCSFVLRRLPNVPVAGRLWAPGRERRGVYDAWFSGGVVGLGHFVSLCQGWLGERGVQGWGEGVVGGLVGTNSISGGFRVFFSTLVVVGWCLRRSSHLRLLYAFCDLPYRGRNQESISRLLGSLIQAINPAKSNPVSKPDPNSTLRRDELTVTNN